MGLFSFRKNSIKFPEFTVGVFGKLPFYKDFLYSSFDKSFADLRDAFDSGFDTLIRSQASKPYVSPNRRFLIYFPKHRVDLVGCVWESDDGLRCFPFMIATTFPKKFKAAPFSVYWQALEGYWKYLSAYYEDLRAQSNPTDFYKRVRGVVHQPPTLEAAAWSDSPGSKAKDLCGSLDDGFLTPMDLTGLAPHEEAALLRTLTFKQNPSFVLWPSADWRERANIEVTGYFGCNGIDDLRFPFFLPSQKGDDVVCDEDASTHTPLTDLSQLEQDALEEGDKTSELDLVELVNKGDPESIRDDLEQSRSQEGGTLRIDRALEHAQASGFMDQEAATAHMEAVESQTQPAGSDDTQELETQPDPPHEDDIETKKMPIDRDDYKKH